MDQNFSEAFGPVTNSIPSINIDLNTKGTLIQTPINSDTIQEDRKIEKHPSFSSHLSGWLSLLKSKKKSSKKHQEKSESITDGVETHLLELQEKKLHPYYKRFEKQPYEGDNIPGIFMKRSMISNSVWSSAMPRRLETNELPKPIEDVSPSINREFITPLDRYKSLCKVAEIDSGLYQAFERLSNTKAPYQNRIYSERVRLPLKDFHDIIEGRTSNRSLIKNVQTMPSEPVVLTDKEKYIRDELKASNHEIYQYPEEEFIPKTDIETWKKEYHIESFRNPYPYAYTMNYNFTNKASDIIFITNSNSMVEKIAKKSKMAQYLTGFLTLFRNAENPKLITRSYSTRGSNAGCNDPCNDPCKDPCNDPCKDNKKTQKVVCESSGCDKDEGGYFKPPKKKPPSCKSEKDKGSKCMSMHNLMSLQRKELIMSEQRMFSSMICRHMSTHGKPIKKRGKTHMVRMGHCHMCEPRRNKRLKLLICKDGKPVNKGSIPKKPDHLDQEGFCRYCESRKKSDLINRHCNLNKKTECSGFLTPKVPMLCPPRRFMSQFCASKPPKCPPNDIDCPPKEYPDFCKPLKKPCKPKCLKCKKCELPPFQMPCPEPKLPGFCQRYTRPPPPPCHLKPTLPPPLVLPCKDESLPGFCDRLPPKPIKPKTNLYRLPKLFPQDCDQLPEPKFCEPLNCLCKTETKKYCKPIPPVKKRKIKKLPDPDFCKKLCCPEKCKPPPVCPGLPEVIIECKQEKLPNFCKKLPVPCKPKPKCCPKQIIPCVEKRVDPVLKGFCEKLKKAPPPKPKYKPTLPPPIPIPQVCLLPGFCKPLPKIPVCKKPLVPCLPQLIEVCEPNLPSPNFCKTVCCPPKPKPPKFCKGLPALKQEVHVPKLEGFCKPCCPPVKEKPKLKCSLPPARKECDCDPCPPCLNNNKTNNTC